MHGIVLECTDRAAAILSASFLAFVLRHSRPHHFLHERCRQGLVRGESNRPFGDGVAFQFVFKRLDHGGSGKEAAMFRECGEPHQDSLIFKGRHPVTDGFNRLWRRSRSNRVANLIQRAASGFRHAGKIFIHALRSAISFRRRMAIARCGFPHVAHATGTCAAIPHFYGAHCNIEKDGFNWRSYGRIIRAGKGTQGRFYEPIIAS